MPKSKILKSTKRVPEATLFDYEFLILEDSLNKVQCRADRAVYYTGSKRFESFQIERESMNCKMQYTAEATLDCTTSELSVIETCLMEENYRNPRTQSRSKIEVDYPISQPSDNIFNPLKSMNSGKNKSRKRKLATDSPIPASSARDSIFAAADPIKRKRIVQPNGRVNDGTVKFKSSYNGYFAEIVKDLTALSLCDQLMALEAITDEEYETVRSQNTSMEKNRTLLLILSRKELSKVKFTHALRKSGNGHLVGMFFPK